MGFTAKRATSTELRIKHLLNSRGCDLKMAQDQYEVYDLYGYDKDGNNIIFEIKERDKWWEEFLIDKSKVDKLSSLKPKAFLVCSVDGVDYVYDINYIKTCRVESRYMNRTTASEFYGSGHKVLKESYYFNSNKYICKL